MSGQLQLRRGTTAENDAFTGAVGELTVDTTLDQLRLHDGVTAGGAVTIGAGGGDALTTDPLSQFAATTSLQLKNVISDETGSGALVFATSPTLVTPILGTPTSGTLTNCTGLPAAGVTGTALVAAAIGTTVQAYNADLVVGPASATDNAITVYDGTTGALVKDSAATISGGKITCADANTGFTDPNSHMQADNASLNLQIEELAYSHKEDTSSWGGIHGINAPTNWNQAATFVSNVGYVRQCSGTADATIAYKIYRLPTWYKSTSLVFRVYWSPPAPIDTEAWVLRCSTHAGFSSGEAIPALTNLDTTITLDTAIHTANSVYTQDVTLSTVPTEGKTWATVALYRRAAGAAADTHANAINIIGIEIISAVYAT